MKNKQKEAGVGPYLKKPLPLKGYSFKPRFPQLIYHIDLKYEIMRKPVLSLLPCETLVFNGRNTFNYSKQYPPRKSMLEKASQDSKPWLHELYFSVLLK